MASGANGFWRKLKKPFFALAPMAEVTDLPFRSIVRECGLPRVGSRGAPARTVSAQRGGPDVFYTEFVSADGLCSRGREKLLPYLAFEEAERPIVAQFFGANPEHIRAACALARELGFDGVDINMGCPDRKVVKQGAGIALCKSPALAKEIIAAAKEGAQSASRRIPVSVKTRLGYSEISLPWLAHLLDTGIAALAVHLRTMKEMSKVPAHWEVMKEIADMAHEKGTLVLGNGDIKTREEGIRKCEECGLDGVMIGRGIFENPWFFNPDARHEEIAPRERLKLLLLHTRRFTEFWGARKNFNVLKRFFKIYANGFDGAKELRMRLMEAKNAADVERIISETPNTVS